MEWLAIHRNFLPFRTSIFLLSFTIRELKFKNLKMKKTHSSVASVRRESNEKKLNEPGSKNITIHIT